MDVGVIDFEVLPLTKNLTCRTDKYLGSVINKFASSHVPLFGFDEKNKFVGILTIKNSLLNRRHGPLSLISSCLTESPKITKETEVVKIIKIASELRIYTLPVFNKKNKIVGIVRVKGILRKLFEKQVFFESLKDEIVKRQIIVVDRQANVGEAFSIFFKKNISRLAVVDEKGKIIGIVTKRDILTAYFSPTDRQRFSTRSVPKNYSFDEEKIYRDDQKIEEFMSPIAEMVDKEMEAGGVLKKLIKSRFNAIVMVDKDKRPFYIMTLRDVLKSTIDVLGRDERPSNIIINFPDKFGLIRKRRTRKVLENFYKWLDKKRKIQLIKMVIKTSKTVNKKVDRFELKLLVSTDKEEYISSVESRNFLVAINETIDQIKKQVARSD